MDDRHSQCIVAAVHYRLDERKVHSVPQQQTTKQITYKRLQIKHSVSLLIGMCAVVLSVMTNNTNAHFIPTSNVAA